MKRVLMVAVLVCVAAGVVASLTAIEVQAPSTRDDEAAIDGLVVGIVRARCSRGTAEMRGRLGQVPAPGRIVVVSAREGESSRIRPRRSIGMRSTERCSLRTPIL